jgi:hypothetical protein
VWPANFVGETEKPEWRQLTNAFCRVVAVDAQGVLSGPSDYVAVPRPKFLTEPPTRVDAGKLWRYQPRVSDADLSVTVMELIALRGAKDAGIAVPKETIDRALQYVASCGSRGTGGEAGESGFGYQPGRGIKWSTTAAGVMCLMLAGHYKAQEVKGCLDYLISGRRGGGDQEWFVYGHYYAAQAMYQVGAQGEQFKKHWLAWYPDIATDLMRRQDKSGTNRGYINVNRSYGTWGTSMCVLILTIPYRYLPIYQR